MTKPIAVVLPMREQVTSGRAGAVALNVSEFGHASAYRERLLVVGGTEQGDFALPYVNAGPAAFLGVSWPFWQRASDHYADRVADVIVKHGCVLVEVHNRGRLFHHLARRLAPRTKICLYLHNDPQTIEGLQARTERTRLLERASMVYCLSSYIRDRFLDGVECLRERVLVLPNGVTPLPQDRAPRQQSLLYVGRLIPEKGVDELFDALRRIAGQLPDWQVTIIGRAPERHRYRYERTLATLRTIWGARLAVAQSVPHAEVMQAYRQAAITVFTSRLKEHFGRTALEAMAAGSAVIASRSGGLPEVVGQAGLLLDAVTPDTIEQAILTLAGDPARREALGKAGRERVATDFAIDQLSRRLDTCRDDLLAF